MRSRNFEKKRQAAKAGFTIVELLIALMVSMAAIGAAYSVYTIQQREFYNQQLVLAAQQNLRSAMIVFGQELRMVGFDPEDSGGFGLQDVRRYDVYNNGELDPNGQPVLYYTYDKNEDGILDRGGKGKNGEHPKFRIGDIYGNGRICLTWDNGSGRHPLAENIQAVGFAYAVDADGDGYADRMVGSTHLIWAVDSDNDNLLDTNIDTNDDGLIDERDDGNDNGRIDRGDGGVLSTPIPLDRVKAIRVWIMAVTEKPLKGYWGKRSLVVGDRIVKPATDGFKRLVLETQVLCRNL